MVGRIEVDVGNSHEVTASVCRELGAGLAGILAVHPGPALPVIQSIGILFILCTPFHTIQLRKII